MFNVVSSVIIQQPFVYCIYSSDGSSIGLVAHCTHEKSVTAHKFLPPSSLLSQTYQKRNKIAFGVLHRNNNLWLPV